MGRTQFLHRSWRVLGGTLSFWQEGKPSHGGVPRVTCQEWQGLGLGALGLHPGGLRQQSLDSPAQGPCLAGHRREPQSPRK